jgi:hypothetical protein
MKASRQTTFRVAAVVVAVTAFLMSIEFPPGRVFEAKPAASVRPRSAHAKTTPVSDKMITARITVDDDDAPAECAQLEGGLIRVEIIGKAVYGFSPVISDTASGTVTIKVFRISSIINSGVVVSESLNEVHALVVEKAGDQYLAAYADAAARFKIEIIDVKAQSNAGGEGPTSQNDVEIIVDAGNCCVTCRGRSFCACRVSTPCGGCCDGSCCR